jgi:VanZ family protein
MATIFTLSSFSHLPDTGGFQVSDKVKHFSAYAFLGMLAYRAFRTTFSGRRIFLSIGAMLAIVAIYGATDEFHQSFVPGRECDFFDWLADMAGALSIALIAYIYNRLRGRC